MYCPFCGSPNVALIPKFTVQRKAPEGGPPRYAALDIDCAAEGRRYTFRLEGRYRPEWMGTRYEPFEWPGERREGPEIAAAFTKWDRER